MKYVKIDQKGKLKYRATMSAEAAKWENAQLAGLRDKHSQGKLIPEDCGRPHPQPLCTCYACMQAAGP